MSCSHWGIHGERAEEEEIVPLPKPDAKRTKKAKAEKKIEGMIADLRLRVLEKLALIEKLADEHGIVVRYDVNVITELETEYK